MVPREGEGLAPATEAEAELTAAISRALDTGDPIPVRVHVDDCTGRAIRLEGAVQRDGARLVLVLEPQTGALDAPQPSAEAAREIRELDALRDSGAQPSVTARLYGESPLRQRAPELFEALATEHRRLLRRAVDARRYSAEPPVSPELRALSQRLGHASATPRDVLDIHAKVLSDVVAISSAGEAREHLEEARLLVLELMGDLAAYYRRSASPR
ncbi:hypothetical protein L6R52_18645 [Myxococcota bacterium]|nr:hypothetical protein [Myxococcota bacterium]